jgi:hypothetical protein
MGENNQFAVQRKPPSEEQRLVSVYCDGFEPRTRTPSVPGPSICPTISHVILRLSRKSLKEKGDVKTSADVAELARRGFLLATD